MNRETTIKITVPDGARITARDICNHMRKIDKRVHVQLILTISSDGPTVDEIRTMMGQRIKELRG